MTKNEALQLALEALHGFIPYLPLDSNKPQCDKYDQAITAIKEALETKEGLLDRKSYMLGLYDQKSRLELETKDEPVAWMNRHGACKTSLFREEEAGAKEEYTIPLYTTPQRTFVGLTDEDMNKALDYWSDDSRSAYGGAHAANGEYVDMIETWRYIESKLKERNT